jgi:anion-transporting  ArsA/GET3 family ATPase
LNELDLFSPRFVLFSGKGGVGKSTIASAYALACARRGERTLLMEFNTQDKVSAMFGVDTVGTEIREIEENLFAVNVTPAAAMEEYAVMMLRVRVIYRAIFENRIMRAFLKAIPGLNELVMLGKAYYHVIEENDGRPVWDKVVLDAPATGHGIFLLQIPTVITSILSTGHMFEEAQRILAVMTDPKITALNLVTLAEEMPVNETAMLHARIKNEIRMPMGAVIANGLYGVKFSAQELKLLETAQKDIQEPAISRMIDAARFRVQRAELQARYLDEIAESIPLPRIDVPFVFSKRLDTTALAQIADVLVAQGVRP